MKLGLALSTSTAASTAAGGGGPSAPIIQVLPAITGTQRVGSQLTCSTGTWSGSPSGYTYQWQRGGANIGSATASTYTLVSADFNTLITCEVTATNPTGSTMAESAATAAILWTALSSVGAVFSETFAGTIADYTVQTGTGTITLSGGMLNLTGGNGGFTNYISRTANTPHDFTCLEKWRQEVTFRTPNPVTSSSYGLSAGIMSTHDTAAMRNTNPNWMKLSGDGGTLGRYVKFSIIGGVTNQLGDGGANGLLADNTLYTLVVTRNKNTFTFDLYVGTGTGGSLARTSWSVDTNITTTTTTNIAPNTGQFTLWNHGGTFTITRWIVDSVAGKNLDLVGIGDSNMYGMYAGTNAARYVDQAAATLGLNYEILAGAADSTVQTLSRIDEILALNPRIAYLNTISNDISLGGTYTANYQANYASLVTQLKNAGIIVVHGIPMARDGVAIAGVKTFIDTTYAADRRVDCFTATKNPGDNNLNNTYDIGDNIHGNVACQNLLAPLLVTGLTGL